MFRHPFVLMAAGALLASTGTPLTDVSSVRPLEGVQLYLPGTAVGVLTNSAGRYVPLLDDSFKGSDVTVRAE